MRRRVAQNLMAALDAIEEDIKGDGTVTEDEVVESTVEELPGGETAPGIDQVLDELDAEATAGKTDDNLSDEEVGQIEDIFKSGAEVQLVDDMPGEKPGSKGATAENDPWDQFVSSDEPAAVPAAPVEQTPVAAPVANVATASAPAPVAAQAAPVATPVTASETTPGVEDQISDTAKGGDPTVQGVTDMGKGAKKLVEPDAAVFPTEGNLPSSTVPRDGVITASKKVKVATIIGQLDRIANIFEKNGLRKHAATIDVVTNSLEKKYGVKA